MPKVDTGGPIGLYAPKRILAAFVCLVGKDFQLDPSLIYLHVFADSMDQRFHRGFVSFECVGEVLSIGLDDFRFEQTLTTEHRFQTDEPLIDPQTLFINDW